MLEKTCKEMIDLIDYEDMSIRCGTDGDFSDYENLLLKNLLNMKIAIKKYLDDLN